MKNEENKNSLCVNRAGVQLHSSVSSATQNLNERHGGGGNLIR